MTINIDEPFVINHLTLVVKGDATSVHTVSYRTLKWGNMTPVVTAETAFFPRSGHINSVDLSFKL